MEFRDIACIDETVKFKENASIIVTRYENVREIVYNFCNTKYINENIQLCLPRGWGYKAQPKKDIKWKISPPSLSKEINKPEDNDIGFLTYTISNGILNVYLVQGKKSLFLGRSLDLIEIDLEYTNQTKQMIADPYYKLILFENLIRGK